MWGAGDGDGNPNQTAETLCAQIAVFSAAVSALYAMPCPSFPAPPPPPPLPPSRRIHPARAPLRAAPYPPVSHDVTVAFSYRRDLEAIGTALPAAAPPLQSIVARLGRGEYAAADAFAAELRQVAVGAAGSAEQKEWERASARVLSKVRRGLRPVVCYGPLGPRQCSLVRPSALEGTPRPALRGVAARHFAAAR